MTSTVVTSTGISGFWFWLILVIAVVAVGALITLGIIWWRNRGDAELQELDKELKENRHSAGQAAMRASKRMASASAVGREVRHTRRDLAAEDREERHRRELEDLTGGTINAGGPPAPPPHP